MFVRLSAAIAAVSLLSGAALAQGAKPTDPQIAHIAYTAGVIDVKQDMATLTESVELAFDGVFMLNPGEFVLGSTLERVALPDDLVAGEKLGDFSRGIFG